MDNCLLCKQPLSGPVVQLTTKGLATIKEYSKLRNDGLACEFEGKENITVHTECRKRYTRRVNTSCESSSKDDVVRCQTPRNHFDFKNFCVLCGRPITDSKKSRNPDKQRSSEVLTIPTVESMRLYAGARDDDWGRDVSIRLSGVIDLRAADGRYHRRCFQAFQVPGRSVPGTQPHGGVRETSKGREKAQAFETLCEFLENSNECQHTIQELLTKMAGLSSSNISYSDYHLKCKLREYYGDAITITEIPGKPGVVCFGGLTNEILTAKWYEDKRQNMHEERNRIIETAAAIIRQDIRSHSYDCDLYPNPEQISSGNAEMVPDTLRILIEGIINPKKSKKGNTKINRKCITIEHAIISATRPRSFVSPLQLGLSVYLHRCYGSKVLLDLLSSIGVSSSYNDAIRYESSVTKNTQMTFSDNAYIQFVFDNADHNICTLDGKSTFHAMGGIVCVSPAASVQPDVQVPRNVSVSSSDLVSLGLRTVVPYSQPLKSGFSTVVVIDVSEDMLVPESAATASKLDVLWACGSWLNVPEHTGWSGFNERIYNTNTSYQVSAVLPLPFVNLNPNNPSTIYTCLLYAAEQCRKQNQSMVVVTFDQPLFIKAVEMVLSAAPGSPLSSVVVRLGGFHMIMSYLGAVGHIMAGSGLEDVWHTVYAKASVTHMMSGRAYSRALRAHFLTQEALLTLLLDKFPSNCAFHDELRLLYKNVLDHTATVDEVAKSTTLSEISSRLEITLKEAADSGRTGKLWVLYIKLVNILRLFLRAERCGDWKLHIYSVQLMLPYFHAAGHLNYAKSTHIYLQLMAKLEESMSATELQKFASDGCFTVRRSDKFWSGIATDQTIEQVLMRSMKSSGGLTHGRGISASTLARWVHSMPATSRVIEAVHDFSGVVKVSSEQHVELRESRQKRDRDDMKMMLNWFKMHNPFSHSSLLSSLSSGLVADSTVNSDDALQIGITAMKNMSGHLFSDVHLKRKDAVKPLASVTKSITVRGEAVVINPNQLFHRIVCTIRGEEELAEYLKYELSAHPPSLFDEVSMRKGNKSSLATIFDTLKPEGGTIPPNPVFIIDGGHLLHRVVWLYPATFGEVCEQYVTYVLRKYGKCHIVFDGYEFSLSTKVVEQSRRIRKFSSVDVDVGEHIQVSLPQQDFLLNSINKTRLIKLLKVRLELNGCQVHQASADADVLIFSTAASLVDSGFQPVIVGDDTDLIVLLIALCEENKDIKMLKPGMKNRPDKIYSSCGLQKVLGDMSRHILFLHAVTGCDTTSAPFRKGKKNAFQKLKSNAALRERMEIFNCSSSSVEDVTMAGEEFILAMYGVKPGSSLDMARYRTYLKTVSKQRINANFNLAALPPTSAAAKQHSLRVFHQVQQWRGVDLPPTEWGWKVENGGLRPVTTLKEAAPTHILHLISCNCKSGCERNCECRRSGLPCSRMCGYCSGCGCSNNEPALEDEEMYEELDSDIENCESDNHHESDGACEGPSPARRVRQ